MCACIGPVKEGTSVILQEIDTFGVDDETLAGWDANGQV